MLIEKKFKLNFSADPFGYIDAFGLEREFEFSPFDGLELPNFLPIITFITGESGSGKTQLLKIIQEAFNGQELIEAHDVRFPENPLCEILGTSQREDIDNTIKILNFVGLSDARLYYTPFRYLSDSQKFRARIAYTYLLHGNQRPIIIDEFLSTLDRKTAKIMSHSLRRFAEKTKTKFVLATAHDDLEDYLRPDLVYKGKAFPERFESYKNEVIDFKNFDFKINEVTLLDYKEHRLGELHYKNKYTGGAKECFAAELDGEIIGFLLSAVVGAMHENKRRIARVVVHPSYRSLGVGTALVKRYLEWCKPNKVTKVSAISALGSFNPFFEKAGMTRVKDVETKVNNNLETQLLKVNFNFEKWFSKNYCVDFCESQAAREAVSRFAINGARRIINPGGKKITLEEAEQMILESASHAGRFLWNLRPRKISKYELNIC